MLEAASSKLHNEDSARLSSMYGSELCASKKAARARFWLRRML
jgi:hypothetical protein